MVFAEDDQVIQAFSAECPDDSFGDCICRWRMNRRRDGSDTNPSGASPKVAAIHRVAVVQQMARLVAPRRRLDDLSPHPGRRRVGSHIDVHQLAPAVGDEYQHVQCLERERGYCEQVGCPHVMRVVRQERALRLTP